MKKRIENCVRFEVNETIFIVSDVYCILLNFIHCPLAVK